ncbi:MAG: primosomal protein N' [Anaerolineae bacterium]
MTYVKVALNIPVNRVFHYHIPPRLQGKLEAGQLVRVAFSTGQQPGIVMALDETSPVEQTKPVLDLLDPQPVLTAQQMAWSLWISQRYAAPVGMCLWLWLPPGITNRQEHIYSALLPEAAPNSAYERRLLELLKERGPLRAAEIQRQLKFKGWQKTADELVRKGVLEVESALPPPRDRARKLQTASLIIHPERIEDNLRYLGKATRESDLLESIVTHLNDEDRPPLRRDLLNLPGIGRATLDNLVGAGLVTVEADERVQITFFRQDIDQKLFELRAGETDLHILRVLAREEKPVDVSWIYAQTGAKMADLKRLEARNLIRLGEARSWRESVNSRAFVPIAPPRLTSGQRAVWAEVRAAIDEHQHGVGFLLHGVTGSGKTEIYLRAIERVLAYERQAMLLVPEVALTPQTIRRVLARFPGRVAVWDEHDDTHDTGHVGLVHYKVPAGARYDIWQRARAGEVRIIVGTRSALFTPLPDVGLIILDEEHDSSYKQSPGNVRPPYYHAREVAERMIRDNGGVLILGSATPDVETMYRAQQGDLRYLHLPDRIMGHRITIAEQATREGVQPHYSPESSDDSDALTMPLPPVQVVDMRDELKAGNTEMFSRALQTALTETLARGEQAILYLNRRGASTYVFCRDCGYIARCPHCDTPMTYHSAGAHMACHHCGHQEAAPAQCPNCQSRRIKYFGAGTQQVEETLHTLFPQAQALRWDADTASRPGAHDLILQRFMDRQADVLIGTQMVAKGLDLPLVTLVGVVSADLGVALPDFRAGERVFQLLTQVAGRAGRGILGGQVILQTYQPDHYAIKAASQHDYASFYAQEIAYRREIGYPPFRRFVRLLFQEGTAFKAQSAAEEAALFLQKRLADLEMTGTDMFGPAPAFFGKVNQQFRWQILLRGPNPARALEDLPHDWLIDVDPVDML